MLKKLIITLLALGLFIPAREIYCALPQAGSKNPWRLVLAGTGLTSLCGYEYYKYFRNIVVPRLIQSEIDRICTDLQNNNCPDTYDALLKRVTAFRDLMRPHGMPNILNFGRVPHTNRFNKLLLTLFFDPYPMQEQINRTCEKRFLNFVDIFFDKRFNKLTRLHSGTPYKNFSYDAAGSSFIDIKPVVNQTFPLLDWQLVEDRYNHYLRRCKEYSLVLPATSKPTTHRFVEQWAKESCAKLNKTPEGRERNRYDDKIRRVIIDKFLPPGHEYIRNKVRIFVSKKRNWDRHDAADIHNFIVVTIPAYSGERGCFDLERRDMGAGRYITLSDIADALSSINSGAYAYNTRISHVEKPMSELEPSPWDMFDMYVDFGCDGLPNSHYISWNSWISVKQGIINQERFASDNRFSPKNGGARIPVRTNKFEEYTYAIFPHYEVETEGYDPVEAVGGVSWPSHALASTPELVAGANGSYQFAFA